MKKLILAVSLLAAAFVNTGCELTGDPSQGGIFWSPTKAAERQEQLRQELNAREQELQELNRRNSSLRSTRSNLR
ncbi:MAG: hypothetical protein IKJ58_03995 [Akkermansia sp.]|nr:hypothetical protein [Akkermansia sp.]